MVIKKGGIVMGIFIGEHNRIKNSTIAERINNEVPKKNFIERHPVMVSVITSFVVGFVLLFSFWRDIISWMEGLV
jgi:hypothetical protein